MGKPSRIRRETAPASSNQSQPNQSKVTQAKSNSARAPQASPGKATGLRILLHLTQRHPILFWTGAWLGMVFVSWLAIWGLTYTNPAPLEVTEKPQPEVVEKKQPATEVQPRTPATSFSLLAAVAISCAATSVLLARQLSPVKPAPRRFTKRPRSASPKTAQSFQTAAKPDSNPTIATAPTPSVSQPEPPIQPVAPMPTAASHATGWEPAKLADMLDIRQQPSTSSQQ